MEVYGATGYVISDDRTKLKTRLKGEKEDKAEILPDLESPLNDPFSLLAAVVNRKLSLKEYDPSSLANNMLVVEILDAAIWSAKLGRKVTLK